MGEALARRHFHTHAGVFVARVPPVAPYTRFDNGTLPLAKNARLVGALYGQLTFKDGKAFDYPRMAVFTGDPRPDTREHFGNRAPLGGFDEAVQGSWHTR